MTVLTVVIDQRLKEREREKERAKRDLGLIIRKNFHFTLPKIWGSELAIQNTLIKKKETIQFS